MQLQDQQMMRAEAFPEFFKIDRPRSDRLMIPPRLIHVVKVETGKPVRERLQQRVRIEETETPLDLSVAGIMPVGRLERVEPSHELREPAVRR